MTLVAQVTLVTLVALAAQEGSVTGDNGNAQKEGAQVQCSQQHPGNQLESLFERIPQREIG